jgi:hypothetical protein
MPRKKKLVNEKAERLAEAVRRAPEELRPRMEQALRDLNEGLPPATDGKLLSSRVSW